MVFFLVFSLFLAACSENETAVEEVTNKTFDLSGDVDYCVVDGYRLWYLPDRELEALREDLVELLSNPTVAYYEDGSLMGYKPVDPDRPYIHGGYTCALFDVTMDGIPELLVVPDGYNGSSGMVQYFAYDIESGEEVGSLWGGHDSSWCMYFDTEENTLRGVGQFWWRYGWPERDRYIMTVGWSEEQSKYVSKTYLEMYHTVNREKLEGEKDSYGDDVYTETTETRFYVHNDEVGMDDYYYHYDSFVRDNVRINETALSILHWSDVCDREEGYAEKAEKMADALLSTGQRFICKIETEE